MPAVIRTWLGFAAIGAALIHLAVGVTAPFPLSVLLLGFGSAELGWGIATLATGKILVPRVTVGAAIIAVLSLGVTAVLGSGVGASSGQTSLPPYPLAVASLFNFFLAVTVAVGLRPWRNRLSVRSATAVRTFPDTANPGGWRFLTGLIVGAFLLSALTTPALAATEVGSRAVPHGSHGEPEVIVPGDDGHESH